jgi:hypothetical protein
MLAVRKHVPTLFVDRSNRHWIILDPEAISGFYLQSKTPGTIASRSNRKTRRILSGSLDITNACLVCPFEPTVGALRPRPPSRWSSRSSEVQRAASPGGGESAATDGVATPQPICVNCLCVVEDFKDATIGKW